MDWIIMGLLVVCLLAYLVPLAITLYTYVKIFYSKDIIWQEHLKLALSDGKVLTNGDMLMFKIFSFVPLINIVFAVCILSVVCNEWLNKPYTFK